MSELTDFFPSGGGGGGLFYSSPKQMPCRWLANNKIAMKISSYTGLGYTTSATFQNMIPTLGGSSHQFVSAELNTYQELANITNADGGVFHGASGPLSAYLSGSTTNIQEFRITIDGTEYNIVANTGTTNFSTYVSATIGNFPEGLATNTTTLNTNFTPYNNYNSYAEDSGNGSVFIAPPFKFYSVNYAINVPVDFSLMGGVEFKETLKVEIKTNNIPGNGSYDYGFSYHSLY